MLFRLSKVRGVRVDREKLQAYTVQVEAEIQEIEQRFLNALAGPIEEVQRLKLEEVKAKYKTEKGRAGARVDEFNPGSNKQLAMLFVDVMKMPVQFTSATGQPSFKKAHLHTWGDGGEILLARRQRLLVLKQAQNLLKLSEPNSSSRAENVAAEFDLLVTQYNKLFDERRHAEADWTSARAWSVMLLASRDR